MSDRPKHTGAALVVSIILMLVGTINLVYLVYKLLQGETFEASLLIGGCVALLLAAMFYWRRG